MIVGLAGVAWACGGYCGLTQPIQSGERALFRQDGDDWTLFVEAQHASCNPNQTFTWVIPVHPPFDLERDVSLAPAGLFDALEKVTAPRFVGPGGDALVPGGSAGCSPTGVVASAVEETLPEPDPSYLLGQATVGPFDLGLVDGGDPDVLIGWLGDQGYVVPPNAREPIRKYVDQGEIFLVVQLRPENADGLVETLELHCGMEAPIVPLGLTSFSAAENMPLTVYVLAEERVVPSGRWTEVEPELTGVLDTAGYLERMLAAQEAAGERAFTVEYAAPATELLAWLDPDAARVLDHGAYLTRYSAFVDPDEMDDDPEFVFDPSAPDVSPLLVMGAGRAALTPGMALALGALALAGYLRRRS